MLGELHTRTRVPHRESRTNTQLNEQLLTSFRVIPAMLPCTVPLISSSSLPDDMTHSPPRQLAYLLTVRHYTNRASLPVVLEYVTPLGLLACTQNSRSMRTTYLCCNGTQNRKLRLGGFSLRISRRIRRVCEAPVLVYGLLLNAEVCKPNTEIVADSSGVSRVRRLSCGLHVRLQDVSTALCCLVH